MPKPIDLPDCQHRDPYANALGARCHCRHESIRGASRSKSVPWSQCEGCPLAQPGLAVTQAAAPILNCIYRSSDPIHHEPCTCGAAKKIAVYDCDLHKRCVLTDVKLAAIKDDDARKACQCCEGCSDRVELLPIAA